MLNNKIIFISIIFLKKIPIQDMLEHLFPKIAMKGTIELTSRPFGPFHGPFILQDGLVGLATMKTR